MAVALHSTSRSVADELPKSGKPLLIIPAPAPRVGSGLAPTTSYTTEQPNFAASHGVAKAGEISERRKRTLGGGKNPDSSCLIIFVIIQQYE